MKYPLIIAVVVDIMSDVIIRTFVMIWILFVLCWVRICLLNWRIGMHNEQLGSKTKLLTYTSLHIISRYFKHSHAKITWVLSNHISHFIEHTLPHRLRFYATLHSVSDFWCCTSLFYLTFDAPPRFTCEYLQPPHWFFAPRPPSLNLCLWI